MLQYIIEWIWSRNNNNISKFDKKKAVLTIETFYLNYKSNLRKKEIQNKKIKELAKKIVNITEFNKLKKTLYTKK
tara:strand:+ start:255 stop:479 length:225 start_codon:yes stop_codon:yes gene_type:complete